MDPSASQMSLEGADRSSENYEKLLNQVEEVRANLKETNETLRNKNRLIEQVDFVLVKFK